MKKIFFISCLLLGLGPFCRGQSRTQLYLQKVSDSTKVRPLKRNKVYGVGVNHTYYRRLKLTAIRDTALVFTTKRKTKEGILAPLAELEYLETTPVLVSQLGEMGVMVLVLGQIPLIASPFIGLLDNWRKAGEAAAFSGMLAGGGLLLVSPLFLYKTYDLQKEWRIVKRNNP
jgi:hypothetical protein